MTVERVVRPDRRAFGQLRIVIDAAREDVSAYRQADNTNRFGLVRAQRHLLAALETYVRALEAAGLAPHPQLRAEVDLLRSVTAASTETSTWRSSARRLD
ncbi:hypothetical protein [Nocardioides pyridinolyticus]